MRGRLGEDRGKRRGRRIRRCAEGWEKVGAEGWGGEYGDKGRGGTRWEGGVGREKGMKLHGDGTPQSPPKLSPPRSPSLTLIQ